MDELISREAAISHVDDVPYIKEHPNVGLLWKAWIESLPAAQPDVPDINFGDMVSRQAAVDALDEIESEVADGYGYQYEKWRKYFCELPSAQPEQRWIPCSKRPPIAKHKTYWICTDTGYQCECRWTNVNHFWTDLTSKWHWHIMDIPQYSKVVAWRELPEPYREEGECE